MLELGEDLSEDGVVGRGRVGHGRWRTVSTENVEGVEGEMEAKVICYYVIMLYPTMDNGHGARSLSGLVARWMAGGWWLAAR